MREIEATKIIRYYHDKLGISKPFEVHEIPEGDGIVYPPTEEEPIRYMISRETDEPSLYNLISLANLGWKHHYLIATPHFSPKTDYQAANIFYQHVNPLIQGWAVYNALSFLEPEKKELFVEDLLKIASTAEEISRVGGFTLASRYDFFTVIAALLALKRAGYNVDVELEADPMIVSYLKSLKKYIEGEPSPEAVVKFFNESTPTVFRARVVVPEGVPYEVYEVYPISYSSLSGGI